ncbi:chloroplast SRP54 subunit of signal recognition particle [Haematococcus lacustris]
MMMHTRRGLCFREQRQCPNRCAMRRPFTAVRPTLLPSRGRAGAVQTRAAMFDSLSRSMERARKLMTGTDKLTAENIKEPLKEIRRALLEADVSLPVVRRFVKKVEERALGTEVISGVNPDVQFVKVVNDALVELMGSRGSKDLEPGFPQVILMAGLQGVGKTTACGKLALYLLKQKKSVLMVATDVYRPAAIEQLQKLGQSIKVPVFEMGTDSKPVDIARAGLAEACRLKVDAVIVDTAGRLQIDEDMMAELRDIKAAVKPTDTLLVVDAMTGQEAANLVKAFNDEVDISGAVLTKMDGDSRGGAALSVREVSSKPIKFVGVGEVLEALEPFYPERMASRILGMGDMLTLYEKASTAIQADEAAALAQRLKESKFDFNDFLKQYETMNNMGGMKLMKMMPGFNKVSEKQLYEVEKQFAIYKKMIDVMDEDEKADPRLLAASPSKRRRVAQASGRSEAEVSELLGKFTQMQAQAINMGRMMQLGSPEGAKNEKVMRELVESASRQVSPGKVRRKREKPERVAAAPKTKGFGVPTR